MKYIKKKLCVYFFLIFFRGSFILYRYLKPCYYRYLNEILRQDYYFFYPNIDMPFEKKVGFFQLNFERKKQSLKNLFYLKNVIWSGHQSLIYTYVLMPSFLSVFLYCFWLLHALMLICIHMLGLLFYLKFYL